MDLLQNLYSNTGSYVATSLADAVERMNRYHFRKGQFGLVYYYNDSSAVEALMGVPGLEDGDYNITFTSEAGKVSDSYIEDIKRTVSASISDALIYNNDVSANLAAYRDATDSSISSAYDRIACLEAQVSGLSKALELLAGM